MNRAFLQAALSELEQLLREHEVRYAEVVRPLRGRVGASTGTEVSAEVLSEVRELFGGMGSLSDVYISRVNGRNNSGSRWPEVTKNRNDILEPKSVIL